MKTYPIEIIQKAFFELVNFDKYVKFTVYCEIGGKPLKMKAKLMCIWADKKGLKIGFRKVYYKRKMCPDITFYVRDIRWIDIPFSEESLENLCIKYQKKLSAPKDSEILA